MFRPNLKCEISTMTGSDLYGKRTYSDWTWVQFGIVRLIHSTEKTSIRTDASGTHGNAQDSLADARLLFPKNVVLKEGDRIRFGTILLTVVSVFPRYRVTGEHDHWQVDCNIWGG